MGSISVGSSASLISDTILGEAVVSASTQATAGLGGCCVLLEVVVVSTEGVEAAGGRMTALTGVMDRMWTSVLVSSAGDGSLSKSPHFFMCLRSRYFLGNPLSHPRQKKCKSRWALSWCLVRSHLRLKLSVHSPH